MAISKEDKRKLCNGFSKLMAEEKAAQLGVEADDLMGRVANGRINFVQKAKVYSELEKQRQLVSPKKSIRSLRDEDNIVYRIQKEIEFCQRALNDPKTSSNLNHDELSEFNLIFGKLKNRCENISRQYLDLEARIERAKEGDEIFEKGEKILKEIQNAKDKNNKQKLFELSTKHKDLLSQYSLRRKTLEPQIAQAKNARVELLREYWRSLSMRWRLQEISINNYKNQLKRMLYKMMEEGQRKMFEQKLIAVVKQLEKVNRFQKELANRCPPSHIVVPVAMKIWDTLTIQMSKAVSEQETILKKMQGMQTQLPSSKPSKEEEEENNRIRMAFVERNR